MMQGTRSKLQATLCRYATDTLTYIERVREFDEKFSEWMLTRQEEIKTMMDIKDRADKINLSYRHVTQSEEKGKAFLEFMKSKLQMNADSKRAELVKELENVLKDTLGGLKKLDCFLDAVEKLAVTSLYVFTENQVLQLPREFSHECVQVAITTARLICPLLLLFKRDANFFVPKLQNIEVLKDQLEKYIQAAKEIYERFEKSLSSDLHLRTLHIVVDLNVDLSEDSIKSMCYQTHLLHEIRKDSNFRMVFLFQDVSSFSFISEFNERQPRMLQFLSELEQCAVQLDRMKKGAKISSVAGSSVGATGGALSIAGLVLIPFTAGVSSGLTIAGVTLGITSGVNNLVTNGVEIGVNRKHQKKADEVFEKFVKDMQTVQRSLEKVINQNISKPESSDMDVAVGVGKIVATAGKVGKDIDSLVDAASAAKALQSKNLITSAGKFVAQEGKSIGTASKVASDIPDFGKAVKGPLALSKSARVGLITLNALFIGMDAFFIYKDSRSLAKGSETEVSQFLRARASLWQSEMDSWKKIRDSLTEGLLNSEKNREILDTPFYPRTKSCRNRNVALASPLYSL